MRLLVVAIWLWLLTPATYAEDQERIQAAYELLDLSNMEWNLEQSIEQMLGVQLQQNPSMAPYTKIIRQYFRKHMSYANLKHDIALIYAETFTTRELQEIGAFYKTPTGRKAITKMPEIIRKGAEIGAGKVRENIDELEHMIRNEAVRLKSLGSP